MTNPFIKQVGQSAADAAKKMAQQMAREPLEMAKKITSQVSVPEAVQKTEIQDREVAEPQDSSISKLDESAINAEGQRKLAELNNEVKRLIAERQQQTEVWNRSQEELMRESGVNPEDKKTLIQPTSKRKQGFMGATKGKQGTKEMSKSPSG